MFNHVLPNILVEVIQNELYYANVCTEEYIIPGVQVTAQAGTYLIEFWGTESVFTRDTLEGVVELIHRAVSFECKLCNETIAGMFADITPTVCMECFQLGLNASDDPLQGETCCICKETYEPVVQTMAELPVFFACDRHVGHAACVSKFTPIQYLCPMSCSISD